MTSPAYLAAITTALRRMPWMDRAACIDHDPELFFTNHLNDAHVYDEARKVCAGCSVVTECLTFGLDQPHGMWGALAPKERQRLQRRRRAAERRAAS